MENTNAMQGMGGGKCEKEKGEDERGMDEGRVSRVEKMAERAVYGEKRRREGERPSLYTVGRMQRSMRTAASHSIHAVQPLQVGTAPLWKGSCAAVS